ncbi:MAG: biotin/lipoyl-containing protein, partial [Ilumatobacteraceae bacterium]
RATVLVGTFPEPTADGSLPVDERRACEVRLLRREPHHQVIELDGRRHVVTVEVDDQHARTASPSGSVVWTRPARWEDHDAVTSGGGPICPLPGTVIAVHVEAGQSVTAGDLLMVVEAMKMEHKIVATGDAVVADVRFGVGDRVDQGDLLVALDAQDADQ